MTWTWTVNDKTVTGIKQIGEHIIKMQARNIYDDHKKLKSVQQQYLFISTHYYWKKMISLYKNVRIEHD